MDTRLGRGLGWTSLSNGVQMPSHVAAHSVSTCIPEAGIMENWCCIRENQWWHKNQLVGMLM